MRKLLLSLLIVLGTFSYSYAGVVIGDYYSGAAACTTPDNGNEYDESWQSPTDETWVTIENAPAMNTALPGTVPTGDYRTCDNGMLAETAGAEQEAAYFDHGSNIDVDTNDITIIHVFYIDSTYEIAAWGTNSIYCAGGTNTNIASGNIVLELRNGTGDLAAPTTLFINSAVNSGYITIAHSTYYKATIIMELEQDGTSTVDIDSWNGLSWDAVDDDTFTLGSSDVRYFIVGTKSYATETGKIYHGYSSANVVTP